MSSNEEDLILCIEEENYNCTVYFTYTPPVNGVYHLRPENCYPDEPEEFVLSKLVLHKDNVDYDASWLLYDEDFCNYVIAELKEAANEEYID